MECIILTYFEPELFTLGNVAAGGGSYILQNFIATPPVAG